MDLDRQLISLFFQRLRSTAPLGIDSFGCSFIRDKLPPAARRSADRRQTKTIRRAASKNTQLREAILPLSAPNRILQEGKARMQGRIFAAWALDSCLFRKLLPHGWQAAGGFANVTGRQILPQDALTELNLVDHHAGVDLAMTGPPALVLAAAELLNDQLRPLDRRKDLRRHLRGGERRPADLQARLVAIGQDAIEGEFLAGRKLAVIDVEFLTGRPPETAGRRLR